MAVDVCIINGTLVTGDGSRMRSGHVVIDAGKVYLSEIPVPAQETIDAAGMIVAPGFIDIHTHSDLTLLADSRGASKVSQGVTTEIVGNCGISSVCGCEQFKPQIMANASFIYADLVPWHWSDYKEYFAEFEQKGISMNVGCFAGHGTIRASVMGYEDRKPTELEMAEMKARVREAMEQGALGLSSGLIYSPGVFAEPEELIELCKEVASYGGVYTTHMRNESDGLLDSIRESLHVAREAGVSLQISHLKATGKQNWGRVSEAVALIRKARSEGVDVHFDFYPYDASSTNMNYLLPPWVQDGGWEAIERRICDASLRKAMIEHIEQGLEGWISPSRNAGWNRILIASVTTEASKRFEGMFIQEMADKLGKSAPDAMLDLLLVEKGGVGMVLFVMSEADIKSAAASELSMVGSDGMALAADGVLSRSKPHPRSYGSFPRVFRKYQRETPLLSIEEVIYKMTGLPAKKLKLGNRGQLKDGYAADVVVFDPNSIQDTATFESPHRYAEGVYCVFVNGKKAYEKGAFLDPKSGEVVKPQLKSSQVFG